MAGEHNHGVHMRPGARHQKRLFAAFAIIGGYFIVEAVAGFLTNSLALLSDAGHMFTDVIGIGNGSSRDSAGIAIRTERSDPRIAPHVRVIPARDPGCLRNALLLFGVAIWVLVEAVQRLFTTAEVLSTPMLIVAIVGLVANLVAFMLLKEGSRDR